jgi:hypothetical protein
MKPHCYTDEITARQVVRGGDMLYGGIGGLVVLVIVVVIVLKVLGVI